MPSPVISLSSLDDDLIEYKEHIIIQPSSVNSLSNNLQAANQYPNYNILKPAPVVKKRNREVDTLTKKF